ncbi:hypothetical protein [Niastella koreensis]|uniref:hypothetical protein n=1 Tax=Niastella koreensis TaxID=354356 RepID=UPI000D2F2663|nr:hypothetical protein [Niastella koreensis]
MQDRVTPLYEPLIGDPAFDRDQEPQHKKAPDGKGDDDARFYMERRPHEANVAIRRTLPVVIR